MPGLFVWALAQWWWRYAVAAVGGLGLWVAFAMHYERKGAAKAVAKIEKANDHASKIGKRAAERSVSGGVRGQRDPTTRDD